MISSAVMRIWPYCVSSSWEVLEPPAMVPPVKRILGVISDIQEGRKGRKEVQDLW